MSALAKVFVVFVFLLSVTFFGTSATLYLTRENWKQEYDSFHASAMEQIDKLKNSASTMKAAYEQEQKARRLLTSAEKSLSDRLDTAEAKIVTLNQDNVTIKAERDEAILAKTAADKLHETLVTENSKLKDDLQAAHDARLEAINLQKVARLDQFRIKTVLDETQLELRQARVSLKETTDSFESLELAYGAIEKKLGKDGIEAILSGLVAPPIDSIIEEVDPELKLVVLSVGRQDQVKEGFEFTVYREDKFVGKVRVHKVYENLAGARILFTASGGDIRSGDRATTRIN